MEDEFNSICLYDNKELRDLLEQADVSFIPAEFIDYVMISYHDGNKEFISGDYFIYGVPITRRDMIKLNVNNSIEKKVKFLKVFVDIEALEQYVNLFLHDILGDIPPDI